MKLLFEKIKESAMSVLPITAIVVIMSFTPLLNVPIFDMIVFVIASLVLIVSMGVFNLGADLAMTPMGEYTGVGLVQTGKIFIILIITAILGLLITIAEPDLMVLATQVAGVIDGNILVIAVGIGVGTFLLIAVLKIIAHMPLSNILMIFYMLAFSLVALLYENGKASLLPLSFDSGGVTTGPMTVPFIMAFGLGIASSIGGKDTNENSFGLVSLCSAGPIIVVLILSILSKGTLSYKVETYSVQDLLDTSVFYYILEVSLEVVKALGILFGAFMLIQFFILKLPFNKLKQIFIGILITFVGLVVFLATVNIGFLPMGYMIGMQISNASAPIIILFGFIIGMTVVLAEPAVQVLNKQVETVTSGAVSKKSMMIALSLGVGISLSLCIIRQIYNFSILYYLIPGYFLSLILSLFVPPLYTAIAFDSGGVASGPMTSTFILPIMIGMCLNIYGESEVMNLAFGVVALVAMTPLITIQILGFKSVASKYIKNRRVMNKILLAEDNQIIYFDI